MAEQIRHSWVVRQLQGAVNRAFLRAYHTVRVEPISFLMQLRSAYGVPVSDYRGMYTLEVGRLDALADRVIASGMKMAAVQGAGFGLGGLLTIVPDLSVLAAVTMRTIQKLSLVYGFEYTTDDEIAELWVAAASAAGVDISRELLEKEVVNKFVPRVIRRIAVKASSEMVEKWAGRLIPLASSAIGAGVNYYFVRAWGLRAKHHFRKKHLEMRQRMIPAGVAPDSRSMVPR
jgi:hypothetical protein